MCMQNLKFVALPVLDRDNRGYPKNWAVPGYANTPFSLKFLMGFCSDGPSECTGQI